jgi:hypothetical protein
VLKIVPSARSELGAASMTRSVNDSLSKMGPPRALKVLSTRSDPAMANCSMQHPHDLLHQQAIHGVELDLALSK